MAARVGATGRVVCFEPHPELFGELVDNIRRWADLSAVGHITPHQMALSSRSGHGHLRAGIEFQQNRGTASVGAESVSGDAGETSYDIELRRLDDLFAEAERIGVLKLDVEGHEAEVLRGASSLLASHRIRDIVFEEHDDYPAPASQLLEDNGYCLFRLRHHLFGPAVRPIAEKVGRLGWDPPSYLATTDPARAVARLNQRGWAVFKLLLPIANPGCA
jgi:FkbM family methyltransferase